MKKILSLILVAIILVTAMPIAFAEGNTYKVGDIIQFGSYPQSEVTDSATITALNNKAPDWSEWKSYGYYSGEGFIGSMVQGDWMRFTDIVYNGKKYRGVKFTQYRPYRTVCSSYSSSNSDTNQYDNGYRTNTVYWFKFEPIDWRVLDPATGLVMCETIIDSQPYSNTIYNNVNASDWRYEYFNDPLYKNNASDYETSSIRKWLNNDFYNTAFTDSEKKEINTTTLNNDGYYTSIGTTGYEKLDSNSTNDKIFLLSYKEVSNSNFGFDSSSLANDPARFAQGSDYAQSQGLYVERSSGSTYNNNSSWLLRSPGGSFSDGCCGVNYSGYSSGIAYFSVSSSGIGVRPALKLNLSSDIFESEHTHSYSSVVTKQPTHLEFGEMTYTCECGDSCTETITKLIEHTYIKAVTAPSCTTQGYTTYTCECGDTYKADYVKENGHSHTSEITTPATHLKEGVETFTCHCGDTYTQSIPKLTEHTHIPTVTKPTCTTQGYTTYKCECGNTYKADYVNKNGHKYESEITTPATHTKDGVETFTCYCGDTYTQSIPKLAEHTYTSSVTTEPTHLKDGVRTYTCECTHSYTESISKLTEHIYIPTVTPPTCTTPGYTTYTCECGDKYFDNFVDERHTFSNKWTIDEEPTCKYEGIKSRHCEFCPARTDITTIGKLAHNFVSVRIEPSCLDDGRIITACKCGEEIIENIPATGHNIVGSACTECDYDKSFDCSCNCHKSGIPHLIFKILNFFQKLFGKNKICACGVEH